MAEIKMAAQRPAAEDLPFTCQYCSNTLADHLLVYDISPGGRFSRRAKDILCGPCGAGALAKSKEIPEIRHAYLFALTPAGGSDADA